MSMKYIKTFEAYQTYPDYQKGRMTWGTPADLKEDAILTLKRALPTFDEKWIDSIEDQSDDKKGIKFEIKVGKDLIHMFKINSWRGQWEFYLNKKKSTSSEIRNYLEQAYMSKAEQFLKYAVGFDYYAEYIDNGGQYKKAMANNQAIQNMWKELSKAEQNKAKKELYKKTDPKLVDQYFI